MLELDNDVIEAQTSESIGSQPTLYAAAVQGMTVLVSPTQVAVYSSLSDTVPMAVVTTQDDEIIAAHSSSDVVAFVTRNRQLRVLQVTSNELTSLA